MNLLSVLLSAVVFIISVAYLFIRKRHQYWRDHGFPYVPNPHLLFGHVRGSLTTTHTSVINKALYDNLKSRGERYGGFSFFFIPTVVVVDPEMVKTVLVKDFNVFHDRGVYHDAKADPLSAHLIALEGKQWRLLRQKLTPTFTSGKMKQMFGTIQTVAEQLRKHIDGSLDQKEIEIKSSLARFTTDVIGTTAFGIECNSLSDPDSDFLKYGSKVFEQNLWMITKFIFASTFKTLAKKIEVRMTESDVEDFFLGMVKQTVNYREQNNVKRDDFMNLLLQIKNQGQVLDNADSQVAGDSNEKGMTVNELAAQAFMFFAAGFETSSTTMNFCLYELAKNPEIQERLREEINRAIDENGGEVTYDLTMNLPYLEYVICETLRKYPPIESLTRVAKHDYTIPGTTHVIPRNTLVLIPAYAIHHDPEHYPDPEKFDPDRFLPEEVAKRHQYVYLPFGEGPRVCIGLRFGLMQTKLGLITLLRNFRFSPTSRTPDAIAFDPKMFVLSPNIGNYLKVEKL